nr:immunoglobulin heavy chain junction region [Macaca mulatta]MOV55498.1 immunoglobulin heavy chain junction region [Macaca mulatta]MOV59536.1 immunoglobulin heavy chain junction region [Macaca mulatta]
CGRHRGGTEDDYLYYYTEPLDYW